MPCIIYCLVPQPQQLEPLIDQLGEAGIETSDITVILRRHWQLRSVETRTALPAPATQTLIPLTDNFWLLPFVPATLWWQWVAGNMQAAGSSVDRIPVFSVPLAEYEAILDRGRDIGPKDQGG